jgi:hypothetical protein
MPSRDFHGILKMSLFHCSLFYKTITKWFSKQDSVIHALGMLLHFRKRKNTLACGSSIFTLSESLATSLVHGHAILHGKPFGIPLLLHSRR